MWRRSAGCPYCQAAASAQLQFAKLPANSTDSNRQMGKTEKAIGSTADPAAAHMAAVMGAKPDPAPNLDDLIREEVNPAAPEQFDPAIHETDPATGGPVFNADNTLRRKRGRRPGQSYAAGGASDQVLDPPAISPAQAKAEADLASSLAFSAAVSIGGEAWEPEPEERDQVTAALATYIEVSGGLGIPPWAAVLLAFGQYAIRRTDLGTFFGMARADTSARRVAPGADFAGEPEPAPEPAPAYPRGTSSGPRPPAMARELDHAA